MTFVLKRKSRICPRVRSSALHPTVRLLGKLRPAFPKLQRQQNSVYPLRVQELLEAPNVLLSPPQRRLARAKREGQWQGVGFRKGPL
jgi:hypothetical protein